MRALLAGTTLLLLAAPGAEAGVRLTAEATPSARRPVGRIVFGVTLENDASPDRGTLVIEQVGFESPRLVELDVALASRARKQLRVVYDTLPGSLDFELRFESQGEVLARELVRVPTAGVTGHLVGVFGPIPGWLQRRSDARLRPVELTASLLPSDAGAWPDLDAILWPDPRAGDLEEETAAALRDWVGLGGRLLTGTAIDQPRALAVLGFSNWPRLGESYEQVAFGEAARSELDLSRVAPPDGLDLAWRADLPDDRPVWSPQEAPFETVAKSILALSGQAPPAPARSVACVLLSYLLIAGPGEWWARRRAARRGRRQSLLGRWRRPTALALAVGTIVVLAGGLRDDSIELVRIDVIDVDSASGVSRGRSYAVLRRRAGGWMQVETPEGSRLSAGLGSLSGRGSWWDGGDYEPGRRSSASLGPEAGQREVRLQPAQWSSVTWRIAFAPEPSDVAEALALARRGDSAWSGRVVEPITIDPTASDDEQVLAFAAAEQARRACLGGARGFNDVLRCATASLDEPWGQRVRRRGFRRPDLEWPAGTRTWVGAEARRRGPELRVDGVAVTGFTTTVWRVLVPEDPS